MHTPPLPFANTDVLAAVATMHSKERVIGPALEQGLGLRSRPVAGLDTDRFGTFSREIERVGSQRDAALAKIEAAFQLAPWARIAVASEGSFGPHPELPFVAIGRELVLMVDRETGLEIAGHDASPETNFCHAVVSNLQEMHAIVQRARFPEHALIVIGCVDGQPEPGLALTKDITEHAQLEQAIRAVVAKCGAAFVESDMRAHRNPTRMRAIERATLDLVRRYRNCCPECASPGFDVTRRLPGLPCAGCGLPTQVIRHEVLSCPACGFHQTRLASDSSSADPRFCNFCNP